MQVSAVAKLGKLKVNFNTLNNVYRFKRIIQNNIVA
jgi:hypothetical protein